MAEQTITLKFASGEMTSSAAVKSIQIYLWGADVVCLRYYAQSLPKHPVMTQDTGIFLLPLLYCCKMRRGRRFDMIM